VTQIVPTATRDVVTDEDWVSLGHVARPHGIKGGLRLHLWNADSETIRAGLEVELRAPPGSGAAKKPKRLKIASVYGPMLVTFDGVPDRTAAEPLQGAELFARRGDFPAVEEDEEGYLVDYVGALLVDEEHGERGVIEGFSTDTAQPLAQVKVPGKARPVLVPFVDELVVRIEDGPPRRVVMRLPEGLFDLDENAMADDGEGET
jgi:16S rRNA processing protein RimM